MKTNHYDSYIQLLVGHDNNLLVPSMKELVLSPWSHNRELIKSNFNLLCHNIFYNKIYETPRYHPIFKKGLVQAPTHDRHTVVNTTNSCKSMLLKCMC